MKKLSVGLMGVLLLYGSMVSAAEIKGRVPDNTPGRTLGGWGGFLLGGAAAGPVGAIVGGLVSAWAGGEVQQASGLSADAYLVVMDDGSERIVRSPNRSWNPGDQVDVVEDYLVDAEQN